MSNRNVLLIQTKLSALYGGIYPVQGRRGTMNSVVSISGNNSREGGAAFDVPRYSVTDGNGTNSSDSHSHRTGSILNAQNRQSLILVSVIFCIVYLYLIFEMNRIQIIPKYMAIQSIMLQITLTSVF